MIAGYIIGSLADLEIIGPSVLAVFTNSNSAGNTWAYIGIGTGLSLVMLVIAIVGIRISARTQVGMAFVEYIILIGLATRASCWFSATITAPTRSPKAGSACPG